MKPQVLRALIGTVAALGFGGCPAAPPSEPPPLPFGEEATAPTRPRGAGGVELGRLDGEPLPQGRPLHLTTVRLSCLSGPEPGLDNEAPAAQAAERFWVELEVEGWASVTAGVQVLLWDGVPDPSQGLHRLAYRALRGMAQDPGGASTEAYGHDRFTLAIPVLPSDLAAAAFGTTLPCSTEGIPRPDTHDLMVCATDARDLLTRHCWFCGPHLGAATDVPGDTVGRVAVSGAPGQAGFAVTAEVDCAYGPATP